MHRYTKVAALAASTLVIGGLSAGAAAQASPRALSSTPPPQLTVKGVHGNWVHLALTIQKQAALTASTKNAPVDGGLLAYAGGPVVTTQLHVYTIYWIPSTLQSGSPFTTLSSTWQSYENTFFNYYNGNGLASNNNQYYQIVSAVKTFIPPLTTFTATAIDTAAYPTGHCTSVTNCITDADIQAEVTKERTAHSWPSGLGAEYFVYTDPGENSCVESACTHESYVYYCAYHSDFTSGGTVLYANMPYTDNGVSASDCGDYYQDAPNGAPGGTPGIDSEMSTTSHELTETITDPVPLTGWEEPSNGSEIGDLCAYNYGLNTWNPGSANGKANHQWWGRLFELQQEYSDHVQGCVQEGP